MVNFGDERAVSQFSYGKQDRAAHYLKLSKQLKDATYALCYDAEKQLFADTPEKDVYTQHANVLAILNGILSPEENKALMQKVLHDEQLLPAYLFFKFYVFQALDKAGMGDLFLEQLEPWKEFLDYGFTTFPEFNLESRSDCHPWSTHPAYFLLSTTAGIKPSAPGFKEVRVEPYMGQLKNLSAAMPHPQGHIRLDIKKEENEVLIEVELPLSVRGYFVWEGQSRQLHGGRQQFSFTETELEKSMNFNLNQLLYDEN